MIIKSNLKVVSVETPIKETKKEEKIIKKPKKVEEEIKPEVVLDEVTSLLIDED